jgi:molybdopterin/thiamine biosynthesis adenylyltransferase
LGSVGSIVAEILARTGIVHFTLIDFDAVEEKNLDRLTNVFDCDIGRAKVLAVADGIRRSTSAPNVHINCCEYSICEKEGFENALNCDILFSCVDRPWPRQVLNFIAYAHLLPVIDGGILVRTNKQNTKIVGADWKAQTVGYHRPCLECLGQYKTENAALEKTGMLDDPEYIKGLDKSAFLDAHENVYVFSSHLASMEVLQMLSLFIAPSGINDVGQQLHHFVLGSMDADRSKQCHENCFFPRVTGKGDFSGINVCGEHKAAADARLQRVPNIKKQMANHSEPFIKKKKAFSFPQKIIAVFKSLLSR